MVSEAKAAIDAHWREELKGHAEQVKVWIRNRVPLGYRTAAPIAG
jgi:hypothetical protein